MSDPSPISPRLLDERTAAAYLGVGRTTFRARWRAGAAPAPLREGRRVLWDRRVLDRFIDARSGINDNEERNSWDE